MKLFLKVRTWLLMVMSTIGGFFREWADPALLVTSAIKGVIDNPAFTNLTEITPQQWDNILLERTRAALLVAVELLELSKECSKKETDQETIACFIRSLAAKSPQIRNAVLSKLAALIAQDLSEGQINESQADWMVQTRYWSKKEGGRA
jgi:hypothetical protein